MTEWYWHVHHDILVEPLTEPVENRIAYIKENKPAGEVETRLRLLKPVRGPLPAAYVKAEAAYDKARDVYDKAWAASIKARAAYVKAEAAYDKAEAAYDKARAASIKARAASVKAEAAYVKARAAAMPELDALHRIECPDCPWNGRTIFP